MRKGVQSLRLGMKENFIKFDKFLSEFITGEINRFNDKVYDVPRHG